MGLVARHMGYRVPQGYRLARRWAHAGPRTSAHPGAIMAMAHHVGVVLERVGRRVLLLSGNHSHKVGIGWYSIARAIAFIDPVKG